MLCNCGVRACLPVKIRNANSFPVSKSKGKILTCDTNSPTFQLLWGTLELPLKGSLYSTWIDPLLIFFWLWQVLHITAQSSEHFHPFFNQSVRNFFGFWFRHCLTMEREEWGELNKYPGNTDEETLLKEIAKSFIYLNYWYDCLSFPFSLPGVQTKEPMTFICF